MKKTILKTLFVVMALGAAPLANAQSHTIRVENGKVYVNGELQPAELLPSTLELEGLTANLSFSGPTHFRLGDHAYSIKGERLVAADPSENEFVIFLGKGGNARFDVHPNAVWTRSEGDGSFGLFYEQLDGQLKELDQLHTEFGQNHSVPVALRMKQESEEAALMVRSFPRIEMQAYLEDLQGRNEGLYDGILREQLLDMETRRLASRLLATQNSGQRVTLREQLAEQLDEIFELKQANRRAEIDQLEVRLTELRGQMDTRESHRKEIIERRIRELLGERN